jgi:predicted kinase
VRELRYPSAALLVVGGPSGAGKTTLVRRALAPGPAVLDPDDVRATVAARQGAEVDWPEALAAHLDALRTELDAGRGVVVVTTALRHGHRIGLAREAARRGRPAHLVMLDADLETCRAGRAAQGDERIPEGLFLHLHREWMAMRRELEAGRLDVSAFASVRVLDRAGADAVERIVLGD